MTVYILATCDTKGEEAAFVRDVLVGRHTETCLVDTGCLSAGSIEVDIERDEVFRRAGTTLEEQLARGDRGEAVTAAAEGATRIVLEAHERGELSGVLGLGGSAGTTIGTAAMRALPIGLPKVMVSTLASGPVRQYVGDKDILMLNSVVDIAGLNSISRQVLMNAALAMAGMLGPRPALTGSGTSRRIAATMFGVTTACIEKARTFLESERCEVIVFHATGSGGQAMESLIRDGAFDGVLDLTTTELADELVGGVLSAGPARLTAAAEMGVPQVVSVGALDMVNFLGRDTVPERFSDRRFYRHNANVTLMRTTPAENRKLGTELGTKVSRSKGPAAILLPAHGVSAIDAVGEPFCDPEARDALFAAITETCGDVECGVVEAHINDTSFAEAAAARLLHLMRVRGPNA